MRITVKVYRKGDPMGAVTFTMSPTVFAKIVAMRQSGWVNPATRFDLGKTEDAPEDEGGSVPIGSQYVLEKVSQ